MSKIEIRKVKERHTDDNCGGEIEVRIDRKNKRVTTVCLKCRKGSIVEKGKVIVDGQPMQE